MGRPPAGTLEWAKSNDGSLSARERAGFRIAAVNGQLAASRGRVLAALRPGKSSATAARTAPPDSRLAREAFELAADTYSEPLLRHCLRSWHWADLFAQRGGVTYDAEILYLACLLHDMHVGDAQQDRCFAIAGARAAEHHLHARGVEETTASRVGDAIALHMNITVPLESGPEAYLLHEGTHLDVLGARSRDLDAAALREVLDAHPRTGFVTEFGDHMRRQAAAAPYTRAGLAWQAGMALPLRRNPLDRIGAKEPTHPDPRVGTSVTLPGGLTAVAAGPADADRPPILLLHGMMGGAWQFSWFQQALSAAGYRSLALNYRGHHGSATSAAPGRHTVEDYAEDARTACEYLGTAPIVVGQSMGGLIAQILAARGAVRAAVLVCSLPPAGIRWRGARDPRANLAHLPAVLTGRPLTPRRRELEKSILNRVPAEQRRAFFDRQIPESSRAGAAMASGKVRVDAAAVTCPVLSISAADDNLVLPEIGAAIADRYHGRHLRIENAGHYALVGEPGWEEVAARILAWIGNLDDESH